MMLLSVLKYAMSEIVSEGCFAVNTNKHSSFPNNHDNIESLGHSVYIYDNFNLHTVHMFIHTAINNSSELWGVICIKIGKIS